MRIDSILVDVSGLDESMLGVQRSYKGDGTWDDPVHNSYSSFVGECANMADEIIGDANALRRIYDALRTLDVDGIITETDLVISKGRSLV